MLRIAKGLTSQEMVKSVTENVEARKQIKVPDNLDKAVETVFKAVEQVNALHELDKRSGGTRLEDLMLPSWVKPFLYPTKVALTNDFNAVDLIERPEKDSSYVYDEAEVTRAAYLISGVVKAKPDMKSVTDLRSGLSMLSEVHYSIGNACKQEADELYVPIPLTDKLSALLGDWSNTTVDKVLSTYFARVDVISTT
jgi:hypothetical protein